MVAATLGICLLSAVVARPVQSAPAPIPEFEASYTVRYGILTGSMQLRLVHDDSGYRYETILRPRGIASWFRSGAITEQTHLAIAGNSYLPRDYTSTDTIADPVRHTRYFFGEHRVTGDYKTQSVDEPMRAGGQNRISVHIAVMNALRNGSVPGGISVFDRARWKTYGFDVIPGQVVSVASGAFDTVEVRYSAADSDREWSLYFSPALEYLPVMLVYRDGGRIRSRAELTDYRIQAANDGRAIP